MTRKCSLVINATSIGLTFTILSLVSSTITIIFFAIKMTELKNYDYIHEYQPQLCRPLSGKAVNISCHDTTMWMSIVYDDRNRSLIENPFALRATRFEAITDRNKIQFGLYMTCTCRIKAAKPLDLGCSYWPDCIINSDFLYFLQRDNERYYRTYVSFIVASVIGMALSIAGLPTTIITICKMWKQADEDYIKLT